MSTARTSSSRLLIARVRVIAGRMAYAALLLALVLAGTVALARLAPGYFDDARELDAQYAATAHARVLAEQHSAGSLPHMLVSVFVQTLHGSLGESRQYAVPVSTLLLPRLRTTASLLLRGVFFGWLLALAAALPAAATRTRRARQGLGIPFTVLLAVPAGALATIALRWNTGGPALVLTLLIAARDFRFLERTLREAFAAPALLYARATGITAPQRLRAHVLPAVLPQLRALAVMSLVTALSALVPVEVLFDAPGIGRLAWNAALNRDLPVLLAVTLVMAAVVAALAVIARPEPALELQMVELA